MAVHAVKAVAICLRTGWGKVKEWLEMTYPGIKRRAKAEKGDIYWGDETTVKACDVRTGVCASRRNTGGKPYGKERERQYGIGDHESRESILEIT
jgi:hypothetical protein